MKPQILADKNALGIVVVCYNRPKSSKRLLDSLNDASYPENMQIPLVISVDKSDDADMYALAYDFVWRHGPKYVIIQPERLGLKQHIYSCGDLSIFFKGVIILEDDLFVASDFYHYSLSAVSAYGDDPHIAGIALNADAINGYVGFPTYYWNDGTDAIMVQYTVTWGELFTDRMWQGFREWEKNNNNRDPNVFSMPQAIKDYKRAWSKYYNMYLLDKNLFFVHPHLSTVTNFGEAGEHGGGNNMIHARMILGHRDYVFSSFNSSAKYDIYCDRIGLGIYLGVDDSDLCVDFYGDKMNEQNKRYWLTPYIQHYKVINQFALVMEPMEANIIYNIQGDDLFLYDTYIHDPRGKKCEKFTQRLLSYHFRNTNWKLVRRYYHLLVKDMFFIKLKGLFHKWFH